MPEACIPPCVCGEDTCALIEECCWHAGEPCGPGCEAYPDFIGDEYYDDEEFAYECG